MLWNRLILNFTQFYASFHAFCRFFTDTKQTVRNNAVEVVIFEFKVLRGRIRTVQPTTRQNQKDFMGVSSSCEKLRRKMSLFLNRRFREIGVFQPLISRWFREIYG